MALALQDGRRDTLRELEGMSDQWIDLRPSASENSVGTLLYHVALIEADWLFDDIFGVPLGDSEASAWFQTHDRDADGRLTDVRGESLDTHLRRLAEVRTLVMGRLQPMSVAEFHAPRRREHYDVSPAWVVHHLLQHEAEHRSEIGWLTRQLSSE
jgi:uncharacterized damage-inducible protein DinB